MISVVLFLHRIDVFSMPLCAASHMKSLNRTKTVLAGRYAALVIAAIASTGWAQSTPDSDKLVYQMQPGDTLIKLISRHMQGPDALQSLVQANRFANANVISVGQKIKIPRHLLKSVPATATVTRLNCKTVVQMEGPIPVPMKTGTVLGEGAVLRIPEACQFDLVLEDESILRLMSGTVVQIKTLRRNVLESSPEVKIELLDGRIDIDVPRKRLSHDAPFQVLTPTSIAGVRGAAFRVGVDAKQGTSHVEVKVGSVGVRGGNEKSEKPAQAGEGVAIMGNGNSLDVEKLLPAPRYDAVEVQEDGKDWLLQFDAVPQAQGFMLITAEDANFSSLVSKTHLTQPQTLTPALGSTPVFYQWSSVSASGLMGPAVDYAICKGYKRQDHWRCNVPFNMVGLINPQLQFEKIETHKRVVQLFSGPVHTGDNNLLVFKSLPPGVYRWRIEHQVSAAMKTDMHGQFELVAIPDTDR